VNGGYEGSKPNIQRNIVETRRECHGFTNLYGLRSQVGTGMGAGWHFRTPVKPAPVTWVSRVLLGYKNINKQPISTTTIHRNHPPLLRHHCHQQSPPPATFVQPWHTPTTPATTLQQPGEHQLAQHHIAVTTWHVNGAFRTCHEV
jgi:hypothetical protein